MQSTNHFKSNLRDTFFNLFEFLKIQESSLGQGPFASMDESTAKESLKSIESFCREVLSLSYVDSDRIPLTLDQEGNVTIPPSVVEAFKAYYAGDWHLLDLPEHLGGFSAPPTMAWAVFEWLVGANPCVGFYAFGTLMGKTIDSLGTESQKKRFVQNLLHAPWGGTMVLTEPDAGSDVGAGTSKARHIQGDEWAITGVKRFITNGDFNAVENIVHLVLARPEGAGVGTKGLSLFIVPKYWVNEDGSMGERNGVVCTNIEKKMGIKGSATCEMTFGQDRIARGLLLGNAHDGIAQMFNIIEHARMCIGIKSCSTLSSAYLNALEYTKIRIQGPDLSKMMDKTSPRVTIIHHPDVRRMLMKQKAYAEGMRALCLWAASMQDQYQIKKASSKDAIEAERLKNLIDFLLPLIKGYNSEKVFETLSDSLQCFGGSGFCQDYPIEQYIRDQKIDTLYEGTTHIQALDFYFRKIVRNQGRVLMDVLTQVQSFIKEVKDQNKFPLEVEALQQGLQEIQSMVKSLEKKSQESIYHIGLQGNKFLFAMAHFLTGFLLLQQAHLANQKLTNANSIDQHFYKGKMATCKFFFQEIFPEISLIKRILEAGTLDLMALSQEDFG